MRSSATIRIVGKRQRKRIRDAEHTAEDLARAAKRLTDAEEDLARAKTRFRLAVRRAYHKQGMSQTQIARLTGVAPLFRTLRDLLSTGWLGAPFVVYG